MKSLADLNQSDVERILDIVDRLNDIEVHLEVGGMKLHVRKFGDASLASAGALHSSVPAPSAAQPAVQPLPAAARPQPSAVVQAATPAPAAPNTRAAVEAGLLEVRAPMLGRFYRASSPSEPAYVDQGSRVGPDDTVCMIEVMKLFNTVSAGVSGTIVEIVTENGAMVEHDAVLFRVRPE